ncbi:immunoglobulin superfamily member 11 isoform X1 [Brienomyrus brachyistius]|uniref:immunoglobulin superfamily member 11 isoform X1 n=1 Tax=Brienomyrus brachyistius TaxID=42636 RepID=UPI0020B2367D|nr:immunoglobulin superfamily member 11 isoform X1 [Brienomyrus brachyistius]
MGLWLLQAAGLVTSLLHCAGTVRVTMRQRGLDVVQGDSIILPCSFFTRSPLSRLSIVWTRTPLSDPRSPSQVIVYDHGQAIESPALMGRVAFLDVPWRADIILNATHTSDAGMYRCVVSNPPEAGGPGVGEVTLSVFAPPSLPLCLWEGDASAGGSVTLSCAVQEAVPVPEMQWDKLEPEEMSLSINMDGTLKGTLSIENVSSQNSGLYRCTVSNALGSQCCYVRLHVYSSPEASPGVLQGALLSLTMTLVLLALSALLLWLRQSASMRWWQGEEDGCYNKIRYTPSLIRRTFV